MSYVMVTGPMGAGKSTLKRSLPEQEPFAPPPGVPEMFLDHACGYRGLQLYEIDEPTALGARWADWLRAADAFLLVASAAAGPDARSGQVPAAPPAACVSGPADASTDGRGSAVAHVEGHRHAQLRGLR